MFRHWNIALFAFAVIVSPALQSINAEEADVEPTTNIELNPQPSTLNPGNESSSDNGFVPPEEDPPVPIPSSENQSDYSDLNHSTTNAVPVPPLSTVRLPSKPFYEINWPNHQSNESIEPVKQEPQEPQEPQKGAESIESVVRIQVKPAQKPVYQNKQTPNLIDSRTEWIGKQSTGQTYWPNSMNSNKNEPNSIANDLPTFEHLPAKQANVLKEPQPTYDSFPPKPVQSHLQLNRPVVQQTNTNQFESGKQQMLDPQHYDRKQCINSICPHPNGYYPHPMDCCSFVICIDCMPHLMRCAANTQYNPFQRTCTYPYQSQCFAPNKDCHATSKEYGAGNIKM